MQAGDQHDGHLVRRIVECRLQPPRRVPARHHRGEAGRWQRPGRTTDIAERTNLYKQAQVIFKDEAPWLTIAHSVQYRPIRKEVEGFILAPVGGRYFYGADLK